MYFHHKPDIENLYYRKALKKKVHENPFSASFNQCAFVLNFLFNMLEQAKNGGRKKRRIDCNLRKSKQFLFFSST